MIDGESKENLINQFKTMGISEDTIFPDKDHLGSKLRRYSSLKEPNIKVGDIPDRIKEIELVIGKKFKI